MREIKFRSWDGKKMFSASEMGRDELQINPDGRGFFNANPTSPRLSEYYSHMIPLQYTGLYDREGNEVYEGDILLNFDRSVDGNKGEYMSVYWDEEEAAFYTNYVESKQKFPLADSIRNLYCVVGNIYENPELLSSEQSVQECDARDA